MQHKTAQPAVATADAQHAKVMMPEDHESRISTIVLNTKHACLVSVDKKCACSSALMALTALLALTALMVLMALTALMALMALMTGL